MIGFGRNAALKSHPPPALKHEFDPIIKSRPAKLEAPLNSFPTIATERLILRAFQLADAANVQRLAGDFAVADTTANIPHPYQDGMAETWISTHADRWAKREGLALAVTLKPDGLLVGAISLMAISRQHQAELGYWIGRPYWGHGYCTEAGTAVLAYAFQELALIRIHARHLGRNPASGRVMQKLGLRHEGSRRKHLMKWDRPEDEEQYGILREDWRRRG